MYVKKLIYVSVLLKRIGNVAFILFYGPLPGIILQDVADGIDCASKQPSVSEPKYGVGSNLGKDSPYHGPDEAPQEETNFFIGWIASPSDVTNMHIMVEEYKEST